jgi:hypothetical protein
LNQLVALLHVAARAAGLASGPSSTEAYLQPLDALEKLPLTPLTQPDVFVK